MNIIHQPSRHRFELEHFPSCYIEYTLEEDVLTVEHTIVEESMRGQGIAGKLAITTYQWAKSHHYRAVQSSFPLLLYGHMDEAPQL